MLKIIFINMLFLFFYTTAKGQVEIYLKEFKIFFTPSRCKDSLVQHDRDSSYITIHLFNCKGEMTFKKYDRFGVLLLTGQYIASLDTLKSYTEQFDLTGEPLEIKVAKYFQPLRHGVWSYYENGILKRTENYQRGIPARDSK